MNDYIFYESGKKIAEFELFDDDEANEKAAELAFALSFGMKNPRITYEVIDNGTKKII